MAPQSARFNWNTVTQVTIILIHIREPIIDLITSEIKEGENYNKTLVLIKDVYHTEKKRKPV